ncbi:Co/Zn/Cd cation transporter [uncultured Desulfobacterium sp.]|uniref:Co/Zn/Cd cation transporter n=1 Tax=uncultured Desulfobacterium sp. TaxID=201089 RepID=A0A445MQY9_9BACT|nr:Co/Zn/Cd cation transporter [uncultured Desulfobacterium sp.]
MYMNHNQQDTGAAHETVKDQETAHIEKIALSAFLLNLCLAAVKAALASYSSSLAVTAGAIDSATDAAASLILFGGLKLSTRKTHSFPLGLYKIENLISVFVALSIFFAGYEIAREVLTGSETAPMISGGVVALLLAGVAATYVFGRYALAVGLKTGSPTLIAEGRHRQVDVLSSIVVLASVMPGYFGFYLKYHNISIDQIAACIVIIFIGRAGWKLLSDGMRVLLDASVDFETLERAKEILENNPMVIKVISLTGRNAGRFRFLQANVIMRTGDLQKAHQISEILELEIKKIIPHVERIIIHYEPQNQSHCRIAVPLADQEGTVSNHFGDSPCFAFVTMRLDGCEVDSKEVLENPHRDVDVAKGIRVAEWLVKKNVDCVIMREDLSRKGPGYVMANAGVKVHITSETELSQAIEKEICERKGGF